MKSDFFARRALLILCVVFFLIPFGMRGARMSLERMENNVKDWLPDSFAETRELAWFAQHFVGEQSFILLTWEGCSDTDESYKLFVEKLRNEIQPDGEEPITDEAVLAAVEGSEDLTPQEQRELEQDLQQRRARQWGDDLGLFTTGDYHQNWGGLDEKWLKGKDAAWFYITPNGDLFRWHGRSNVLGGTGRWFKRSVLRDTSVEGTFVANFGRPPSVKNKNDFHDDPRKLTARVLKKVTTGPEVLAELAAPSGSMWPRGTQYSDEERARIARRRALDRLKGSLFGPEPYESFQWTAEDLPRVLLSDKLAQLPQNWQQQVDQYLQEVVRERYDGDSSRLVSASLLTKNEIWDGMFAELGVAPPGLQTCIMVTLSENGTADLRGVIGRGLLGKPRGKLVELADESGIAAPTKPPMMPLVKHEIADGKVLRMGGPPVDNVAIDEEGQITLVRLIGFSAVLGIALGYICFRRVTVTIMVFVVGGASAIVSLGIVWWSGSCVDAILLSMPSLVYVLGLSGAVHIVNYYREAVQKHGVEGAPMRALGHGVIPCTLAAFTTALGLLSLYTSDIAPIRRFGLFSAIGVMATLILLFTYLPSALQLWPPGYKRTGSEDAESEKGFRNRLHNGWLAIGDWVVQHNVAVMAVSFVALIAIGIGMTKLNTSIQLLKLFDGESKIIRDYYWLESNVGKIVPMELIVSVDKKHQYPTVAQRETMPAPTPEEAAEEQYQYNFLERIELVAHVQQAVEDVFGEQGRGVVGRALSAATFSPPILDPLSAERFATNTTMEKNRDRLLEEKYLSLDEEGNELWRISVRLGALNDVDYGQFVTQLKRVVEPVVDAYDMRDTILRGVAERRIAAGTADENNPWRNSRVYILGSADPRTFETTAGPRATIASVVADDAEQAPTEASQLLAQQSDKDLGVDRVYAKTLGDLLRAKKFVSRRDAKRGIAWQDPEAQPFPEGFATSDAWARALSSFDCVVVLADHANYDMAFIQEHAPWVIDARQHGFDADVHETAKEEGRPIQVTYTGVVPIVYKAQRTLLDSLIKSIGWAFVMIAAVMMVLLRTKRMWPLNIRGGMVSMIPNVFPVIIVFGAIGHLGIVVDIGTMMTASVAMGVAVDDTIHFLTWFRRGIRDGMDRNDAIKNAYAHVAVAMTQTTIIGGLGLSVFALSTFTPTQRFGTMMLTLLAAALVGDLILLPAILAGPLGKYLCPKGSGPRQPVADPDTAAAESPAPAEAPAVLPIGQSAPVKGPTVAPKRENRASSVVRRDGTR